MVMLMAVIKKEELKKLSKKEIAVKFSELKMELIKARTKISTGTAPENPGRVKEIRKTIARLLTIRREKSRK